MQASKMAPRAKRGYVRARRTSSCTAGVLLPLASILSLSQDVVLLDAYSTATAPMTAFHPPLSARNGLQHMRPRVTGKSMTSSRSRLSMSQFTGNDSDEVAVGSSAKGPPFQSLLRPKPSKQDTSTDFANQMQHRNLQSPLSKRETSGAQLTVNDSSIADSPGIPFAGKAAGVLAVLAALAATQHPAVVSPLMDVMSDPGAAFNAVVEQIQAMGPIGVLYFALFYTAAEVLAIPATPLTASAGYLFGVPEGTAVVLASASVAAAASFWIGRTLLRDYVEGVLEEYPKFKAMDKAIGKEGFKLMLILRLSPVFPFALSNYLYGVTSIDFWPYFWGTLLGFLPGTLAYVYTGTVGKALLDGGVGGEPWYVYAGGMALLVGILKFLSDFSTKVIEEVEAAEGEA